MKKLLIYLAALCLTMTALTGAGSAEEFTLTGQTVTEVSRIEDAFGKADTKALEDLKPDAVITLTDSITLTQKGVYRISGEAENVTITVNDAAKDGNITLILDDLTVRNNDQPVVLVESADKVILWIAGECSMTMAAANAETNAVIYARDDLTVTGSGTLTITSAGDGIDCKDDYRQTGATLNITAEGAGLDVNDSVRIGGGTLSIVSGKDGIHLTNDEMSSWFYLEDGEVSITAGQDGVDVSGEEGDFSVFVTLYGGKLSITAGNGASLWSSGASTKGVKCQGDIYVGRVELTVNSADDALHSGASVSITDGTLTLASGDDGIHADSALSISGGSVTVSQAYEGLEAYEISISGGSIQVFASDDGINAAGGSDTSSQENPWARWSMGGSSSGVLNISGGTLYVNAAGDGLDSNGSIYVTGGLVIVEGPTDNGNGAIDKGDGSGCVASITGGTVLALGSTGMAVNFDTGTQCAALVTISGSAGDTVSVDDGSGFSFTASKRFECAVYSSPSLQSGNAYTLTAGSATAAMDFTGSLYYSDLFGGMGGFGGWGQPGGGRNQPGGGWGQPGGGFGGPGR